MTKLNKTIQYMIYQINDIIDLLQQQEDRIKALEIEIQQLRDR